MNRALFGALATSAKRRLGETKVQELVNTAWSFAKICLRYELLFEALARVAEQRVIDFDEQELANIA